MTESREAIRPLSVRILEKEYIVACGPDERTDLLDSAEILNKSMREIRDGGKIAGLDRIAVMAALNLAHEVLKLRARDTGAITTPGTASRRCASESNRRWKKDNSSNCDRSLQTRPSLRTVAGTLVYSGRKRRLRCSIIGLGYLSTLIETPKGSIALLTALCRSAMQQKALPVAGDPTCCSGREQRFVPASAGDALEFPRR